MEPKETTHEERIEAIVEEYGEGFRKLAANPRINFIVGGVEVTLSKPVRLIDGSETRVLLIEEPTTGHLKTMDNHKGEVAKSAALLSVLAGITMGQVDKIKSKDFILLQEVIGAFLSDAPSTSGT